MAYPQWYIIPSHLKEGEGALGGTLQGRITAKGPSRQTFPPTIQACLASRWPGGVRVSFDLSQIELRVAALLSGEPSMVEAFQKGYCLHTSRAVQIFGGGVLKHPDFDRYHRQVAKTVNFADLFLASAGKLQQTLMAMTGEMFDLPFCQDIVSARSRDRAVLTQWQHSLFRKVRADGYLCLPYTGQSRFFFYPEDKKEIVNFPVQTTAGNTLLAIQHVLQDRLLPELNCRNPWCYMVEQVYDSVGFDVRDPSRVPDLHDMFDTALTTVSASGGYWHMLEETYGTRVPLDYKMETHS